MPSIFNYLDYRVYLREFYEAQKKESPFFSYRYIGKRVGMDSSYLIKVLQGHLHISNKKIENFIKVCGLLKKEAEYFQTLVLFGKAKTTKVAKMHFEKLLSLKDVKAKKLTLGQYEFFQHWYYSAVWSLLNYYPFKDDYKDLAERLSPSISMKQAKQSIQLLEKLGLIKKDETGHFRVTDLNLTTGKEWHSLAITEYQKQMIGLASESLDRFKKEQRDVSTLTMNVSHEALPEINELTSQYRQSLKKLANSYPQADGVYQMVIQLFPLAQTGRKK